MTWKKLILCISIVILYYERKKEKEKEKEKKTYSKQIVGTAKKCG